MDGENHGKNPAKRHFIFFGENTHHLREHPYTEESKCWAGWPRWPNIGVQPGCFTGKPRFQTYMEGMLVKISAAFPLVGWFGVPGKGQRGVVLERCWRMLMQHESWKLNFGWDSDLNRDQLMVIFYCQALEGCMKPCTWMGSDRILGIWSRISTINGRGAIVPPVLTLRTVLILTLGHKRWCWSSTDAKGRFLWEGAGLIFSVFESFRWLLLFIGCSTFPRPLRPEKRVIM